MINGSFQSSEYAGVKLEFNIRNCLRDAVKYSVVNERE
jgi:hypothetical protein